MQRRYVLSGLLFAPAILTVSRAARLANRTSFDVVNLTEPGEMLRLKAGGYFAKTEPVPNEELLPGTFDADGTFRAYGVTSMYGIVNIDKVKPADRPASLAELFTPAWKSRVMISQLSRGGTGSTALMNVAPAIGPDFLAEVKGLDILLTALAIAASLASGIKSNFGTMTKPLHVGQAARNGLYAALLAQEGFTASDTALEHGQGWFNVYNGAGAFFPERALADWAAALDILVPGIAIKQYPCCGSTHPAIDVMIDLATTHGLVPEMVEHMDVWTHPRRLNHTNRPNPRGELDAKFSVQYVVAQALQNRRVVLADFEDRAHDAPAVRAIMARLQAAPHPRMDTASTEHFGAEIRVRLRDGRELSGQTDRPLGRGLTKPLPLPALEAKYLDCAGRVLDGGTARRGLETIWRLDELDSVAELPRLLAAGVSSPALAD